MAKQRKQFRIKPQINKANLIGFGVLALGVLVLLLVGYFVHQKFSSNGSETKSERKRTEIPLYERQGRAPNRAAGEKPVETYERQKTITQAQLKGAWETTLPKGRALLEMKRGTYRLILLSNRHKNKAKYSRGTYEIIDDIVVLKPDLKKSPPKTKGIEYDVLTRGKIVVAAAIYKERLIWQKPPAGTGIYIPPHNAVLDKAKNKIVAWKVLE